MTTFWRWFWYGFVVVLAFQVLRAIKTILGATLGCFTILAGILIVAAIVFWVTHPTLASFLILTIAGLYYLTKYLEKK